MQLIYSALVLATALSVSAHTSSHSANPQRIKLEPVKTKEYKNAHLVDRTKSYSYLD